MRVRPETRGLRWWQIREGWAGGKEKGQKQKWAWVQGMERTGRLGKDELAMLGRIKLQSPRLLRLPRCEASLKIC